MSVFVIYTILGGLSMQLEEKEEEWDEDEDWKEYEEDW
jgi:hypothetical protein